MEEISTCKCLYIPSTHGSPIAVVGLTILVTTRRMGYGISMTWDESRVELMCTIASQPDLVRVWRQCPGGKVSECFLAAVGSSEKVPGEGSVVTR